MGNNLPRARIMLDAHKALTRWADQHGIPLPADGERIIQKVDELLEKIGR